nr:MAG TPA: hypothetical protein [Bacteriophage sp.]
MFCRLRSLHRHNKTAVQGKSQSQNKHEPQPVKFA